MPEIVGTSIEMVTCRVVRLDVAYLFGIELLREWSEAHQVTEEGSSTGTARPRVTIAKFSFRYYRSLPPARSHLPDCH